MKQTLHFAVADLGFTIHYDGDANLKNLIPSYAPFHILNPLDNEVFSIEVGEHLVSTSAEGEEVGQFDCGGINHGVYRLDQGGYLIHIGNVGGDIACAFRSNADFSKCRATVFGKESDQAFGLNNALMIAFAFSAAPRHLLLMHSSVPMINGKGVLCLGKSGTGKSTHSRLWLDNIAGTTLLNDDNPAVKFIPETNEVKVYGTPWSGKTPCYKNESAIIAGFLRLEQYPENIINREPGIKAFASILSSCSTMIWDKPSYNAICNTVARIAERVPVFYLKCLPNVAAAELSHSNIFSE